MKIDRLHTLSQFVDLINSEPYRSKFNRIYAFDLVNKYNDFLKKPLTKEMFVNEKDSPTLQYNDPMYYECELHEWKKSEDKVIFDGFLKSHYYAFNYCNSKYRINLQNADYPKLEWQFETKEIIVKTLSNLAEATNGQLKLRNVEI